MGMDDGSISWFSPDPRGVLLIEEFNVPRSVRAELRRMTYDIRVNTAFREVMQSCGQREQTWITSDILQSYEALHKLGYAHSVEVWRDETLIGGLYGVCVGAAFFGESMFSKANGGSKAALVWLMEHLKRKGFLLHDTQWTTPHLAMFGGREIPREQYLATLEKALDLPVSFLGA